MQADCPGNPLPPMKTQTRLVALVVFLSGCFYPLLRPAAETGSASSAATQVYENKDNGVKLELPKGWLVAERPFSQGGLGEGQARAMRIKTCF